MVSLHRALICFLISLSLLIYCAPLLPFHGSTIEQLFSYSWLVFSILVISGNGLELLYKRKQVSQHGAVEKQRVRQHLRG